MNLYATAQACGNALLKLAEKYRELEALENSTEAVVADQVLTIPPDKATLISISLTNARTKISKLALMLGVEIVE